MDISILIVSHNRKDKLSFTLSKLDMYLDYSKHEILVFLDGCNDTSLELKTTFPNVVWSSSKEILGASRARNILYRKAKGDVFIGFDDDAHPLQDNFIEIVNFYFENNKNLGVIAFQEIKGMFKNDNEALLHTTKNEMEFLCNDFVGCGFAIKKDVYEATNGFPVWLDIYGEESCVAIEVLSIDKDIIYTNKIVVNHRVNKHERLNNGRNYFRFAKQLKNTTFYYIVYYKNPGFKILKLLWHNYRKYALKDLRYFKAYFKTIMVIIFQTPKILKYRQPMDPRVLRKIKELKSPLF